MIIGDSSALIALAVVDKLELLESLYVTLYVPQAVYSEVTQIDRPKLKWSILTSANWGWGWVN
jgi:predicted nucleic acid-binding protein